MIRRLLLVAAISLAGCLPASEPFVLPGPADAARLEARVEADPADTEAAAALAVLWLSQNRVPEARTLLTATNERTPGDPAIPLLLAVAAERMGEVLPAADAYRRYRSTRTGPLAVRAAERVAILEPDVLRARARVILAAPLQDSVALDAGTIAVLPLARTGQDDAAAAESAAVSDLVARDLALRGWDVIDPGLVRVILDELEAEPSILGDVALGVEMGRRLGAGRVVQGIARRVSLASTEWDLTVLSIEPGTSLRIEHLAIEAVVGAVAGMQQRMAALVHEALRTQRTPERLGRAFTTSSDALGQFGGGLRAMDRGDMESASRAFGAALQADPAFVEAEAQLDRAEAALRAPPLDSLIEETARLGELQRAVLALRTAPGSVQRALVAQVGESERALVSDLLGLDDLGGGVLLDVTFTLPGNGP